MNLCNSNLYCSRINCIFLLVNWMGWFWFVLFKCEEMQWLRVSPAALLTDKLLYPFSQLCYGSREPFGHYSEGRKTNRGVVLCQPLAAKAANFPSDTQGQGRGHVGSPLTLSPSVSGGDTHGLFTGSCIYRRGLMGTQLMNIRGFKRGSSQDLGVLQIIPQEITAPHFGFPVWLKVS